ncbi:hypothetical protein [Paenarthrobacter histidinolovorans]|uniref:hypothetical protein n=1 Tax=Paenarthrobacter histidinolovorans TaxID=43664 RepID=UPI00384C792A
MTVWVAVAAPRCWNTTSVFVAEFDGAKEMMPLTLKSTEGSPVPTHLITVFEMAPSAPLE